MCIGACQKLATDVWRRSLIMQIAKLSFPLDLSHLNFPPETHLERKKKRKPAKVYSM